MSTPCNTYVQPIFQSDPCEGERVKAQCLIDDSIYAELNLSANATQQEINQALYAAFLNLKGIVDSLQTQIDAL